MTDQLNLRRQLGLLIGQTVTRIDTGELYGEEAQELRITFSGGKQIIMTAPRREESFDVRVRIATP